MEEMSVQDAKEMLSFNAIEIEDLKERLKDLP